MVLVGMTKSRIVAPNASTPAAHNMLMEYSPFFTSIIWACPGLWPLLPPPLLFYDLLKVSNQGLRAADLIFHFVQCGFWSCANPHFLIEQPLKLILLGFQCADDVYSGGRHLLSSRALRKISNRDTTIIGALAPALLLEKEDRFSTYRPPASRLSRSRRNFGGASGRSLDTYLY
jgi:hypothetical protein